MRHEAGVRSLSNVVLAACDYSKQSARNTVVRLLRFEGQPVNREDVSRGAETTEDLGYTPYQSVT
jgi:hypothetical protein